MPFASAVDKRRAQREWKRRRYDEARAMLGGVCKQCGAVRDLQIDHIIPTQKTARITDVLSRRAEIRFAELAKCQLLCAEHHAHKTLDVDDDDEVPF